MTLEERARQRVDEFRKSRTELWANDFAELGRYRDANAALGKPGAGVERVVFMGDSLTDLWDFTQYFPGKPYINRGISGQTTPQMLIRFRPDVIHLAPKLAVILAGTNDIAGNTGSMRIEDITNNIASMAELALRHGIRVILCSLLPVHNYDRDTEFRLVQRPMHKIEEVNRWLKEYCEQNGCQYLDYFSAMLDEKGLLRREFAEDGLHPTAQGYKIMAPMAEAAITRVLAGKNI